MDTVGGWPSGWGISGGSRSTVIGPSDIISFTHTPPLWWWWWPSGFGWRWLGHQFHFSLLLGFQGLFLFVHVVQGLPQ